MLRSYVWLMAIRLAPAGQPAKLPSIIAAGYDTIADKNRVGQTEICFTAVGDLRNVFYMERNHGLDFLKVICSFMVICIHTPFPGLMGSIITPLTRIAVPLFFMITGYFYSYVVERGNEKKQLLKSLQLLIGANCLFFVWSSIESFLFGNSIIAAVIANIRSVFNIRTILNFVLLNDSPFAGHLWYLSAILYVLLIIYVFEKKCGRHKLYPAVPFLLLADIIFGKYSLLIFGKAIPYIYVRNFLCVGLPYFLIGDMLYIYI